MRSLSIQVKTHTVAFSLLAAAYSPASLAQTSPTLEEVVVTATRKGATNVQEVPIAITAFTGAQLSARGVVDIEDLPLTVPNLTVDSGIIGPISIGMRGVNVSSDNFSFDSAVGVYVNEIYVARSGDRQTIFFDLEGMEVLRGPQGTTFGRNTPSGAVLADYRRPGDEFGGYARAKIGGGESGRESYRAEGALDVPLGDDFAARFAGYYEDDDGYAESDFNGYQHFSKDDYALRAVVRGNITDNLDVLFIGEYNEYERGYVANIPTSISGGAFGGDLLAQAAAGDPTITPTADAVAALIATGDEYTTESGEPGHNKGETTGLTLHFNWKINDQLSLRSLTGYRDTEQSSLTDGDAVAVAGSQGTLNRLEQDQFTQEFLLNWDVNEAVNILSGLYYFKEEGLDENVIPGNMVAFSGLGLPLPGGFLAPIQLQGRDIENEAVGVFASGTFTLSDEWSIQAGIRYTEEEKKVFTDSFIDLSGIGAGLRPLALGEEKFEDDVTTYDVKVIWQPTDDLMTYAKFATGYRAGGIGFRAGDASFGPEEIDSFELGLKSEFELGGIPIRSNLAVFHNEYQDFQVSMVLANPTRQTVVNAGDATIDGFEAEITSSLTNNFDLAFSLGYVDAEYDEFLLEGAVALAPGGGLLDLSNNELRRAPELVANINANYTHPLDDGGDLIFNVGYTWNDDYESDTIYQSGAAETDLAGNPTANLRTDEFSQDGYGILNATIMWAGVLGSDLDISLWGRNLTDESFIVNALHTSVIRVAIYNEPVNYGLTFNYSF